MTVTSVCTHAFGRLALFQGSLPPHPNRAPLVGNSGFRIGRERRIGDSAAQEIDGLLDCAIILLVGRHVGLRARLFVAFRLQVAAQRRLTLRVIGPRLQIVWALPGAPLCRAQCLSPGWNGPRA